jgi:hypothetical protein
MIKRQYDWCFICQKRRNTLIAISYEKIVEGTAPIKEFIRICTECIDKAKKIADDKKIPINEEKINK